MWLEKFIFYGRSIGPTTNLQTLAKALASGSSVPLGKHLLGSVYNLLHQVSVKLSAGEPISNQGGPWWFINLWLNFYMRKVLAQDITKTSFPKDQPESEPPKTRRCTSYGEAVSSFSGSKLISSRVAEHFRCFYNGFTKSTTIWYPYYSKSPMFGHPISFNSTTCTFDREILEVLIKPGILPMNFFAGKAQYSTYEFYNPSAMAHHLG